MSPITAAVFYLFSVANLPALSFENADLFFESVDNRISLNLNGCHGNEILLKSEHGSLTYVNDSTYSFFPEKETKETQIKMYYKNVLVGSKLYPILKFPNFSFTFKGKSIQKMSVESLLENNDFAITYDTEIPKYLQYEIVSVMVILASKNDDPVSVLYKFSDKVNKSNFYHLAQPDDNMYIEKIFIQDWTGTIKTVTLIENNIKISEK